MSKKCQILPFICIKILGNLKHNVSNNNDNLLCGLTLHIDKVLKSHKCSRKLRILVHHKRLKSKKIVFIYHKSICVKLDILYVFYIFCIDIYVVDVWRIDMWVLRGWRLFGSFNLYNKLCKCYRKFKIVLKSWLVKFTWNEIFLNSGRFLFLPPIKI